MRKLKIYLDTSIISHLDQQDAPEKMADTLRLWEEIKRGSYDVFISDVTVKEITNCPEPKRTLLFELLSGIQYYVINVDNEITDIAQEFIDNNILTIKSFDDCLHIACSIVYECDMLISWNFKHIVNLKTQKGVKKISNLTGYREVYIYSPTFVVGGDD